MNDANDKELRDLLKETMTPVTDTELRRDLWPEMLKRLDQQSAIRVPWFDWALAALLGVGCLLFPGVIPALAYHF
jgi:hypothetical protein